MLDYTDYDFLPAKFISVMVDENSDVICVVPISTFPEVTGDLKWRCLQD